MTPRRTYIEFKNQVWSIPERELRRLLIDIARLDHVPPIEEYGARLCKRPLCRPMRIKPDS